MLSAPPAALILDFPGVMVAVAEYEEGPTGTTGFYLPKPVVAADRPLGRAVRQHDRIADTYVAVRLEPSKPTACGLPAIACRLRSRWTACLATTPFRGTR